MAAPNKAALSAADMTELAALTLLSGVMTKIDDSTKGDLPVLNVSRVLAAMAMALLGEQQGICKDGNVELIPTQEIVALRLSKPGVAESEDMNMLISSLALVGHCAARILKTCGYDPADLDMPLRRLRTAYARAELLFGEAAGNG